MKLENYNDMERYITEFKNKVIILKNYKLHMVDDDEDVLPQIFGLDHVNPNSLVPFKTSSIVALCVVKPNRKTPPSPSSSSKASTVAQKGRMLSGK